MLVFFNWTCNSTVANQVLFQLIVYNCAVQGSVLVFFNWTCNSIVTKQVLFQLIVYNCAVQGSVLVFFNWTCNSAVAKQVLFQMIVYNCTVQGSVPVFFNWTCNSVVAKQVLFQLIVYNCAVQGWVLQPAVPLGQRTWGSSRCWRKYKKSNQVTIQHLDALEGPTAQQEAVSAAVDQVLQSLTGGKV